MGANRKPFVDASPMLIRNNLLSPLSCPVGTPAGTAASPWASAEGNLSRRLGTAGNFKEVKCRHNVNTESFISLGTYEGNLVGCIREFSWQESLINTHLNPTNASLPTVWGDISWGGWGPLSFPVIFSVFCVCMPCSLGAGNQRIVPWLECLSPSAGCCSRSQGHARP